MRSLPERCLCLCPQSQRSGLIGHATLFEKCLMSQTWLLKKWTGERQTKDALCSLRSPYAVGRAALSPNESCHKENEERDFGGSGELFNCISPVCDDI